MLSTVYKAGRAPALLRHGRRVAVAPQTAQLRSLTSGVQSLPVRQPTESPIARLQKRFLSVSAARPGNAAQSAPNPYAYLDSGVIKPKEFVDVKKVLVIGSGGLAIGQAGEFDYSGTS